MKYLRGYIANILLVGGILFMVIPVISLGRYNNFQNQYISDHSMVNKNSSYKFDNDYSEAINELNQLKNISHKNLREEATENPSVFEQQDNILKREDYTEGNMIIDIPKLQVKATIVNGTSPKQLKKGPGLYEISPLPSEEDVNVCIAGHRTTYGAWFRHLDKLSEEDYIYLQLDKLSYIYKVEKVFIVDKKDWSVTKSVGYSALTLTSCHPLKSNKQRIIVRAKLDKIENNSTANP